MASAIAEIVSPTPRPSVTTSARPSGRETALERKPCAIKCRTCRAGARSSRGDVRRGPGCRHAVRPFMRGRLREGCSFYNARTGCQYPGDFCCWNARAALPAEIASAAARGLALLMSERGILVCRSGGVAVIWGLSSGALADAGGLPNPWIRESPHDEPYANL